MSESVPSAAIDLWPDNSVLIIPDPARPGSDAPRRIDADGSPLEVYEGAISVTEGPRCDLVRLRHHIGGADARSR